MWPKAEDPEEKTKFSSVQLQQISVNVLIFQCCEFILAVVEEKRCTGLKTFTSKMCLVR